MKTGRICQAREGAGATPSLLLLGGGSLALLAMLLGGLALLAGRSGDELSLYCAAGSRAPLREAINRWAAQPEGRPVVPQFDGSGSLLSKLGITNQGDLYLAADRSYVDQALELGLVSQVRPVARQKPVIITQPGNPKQIRSLADLTRTDVALSLADPQAASIGRQTEKMLTELGLWEAVRGRAVVFKPTVNEVAMDVRLGTVDAAIIWDSLASQFQGQLEMVTTPELDAHEQTITLAILRSSRHPDAALAFADYLQSAAGQEIFRSFGFTPLPRGE